jgi:glycosyltransferase involved in cell wall biosynthesis
MDDTTPIPGRAIPGGISIVVPVFNESGNLPELHRRLTDLRRQLGRPMEVILVDDGSTDGSAAELARIALADPDVVVVRLTRNFGQTAALSAGIAEASHDVLVTLDADLQNDPADIPKLLEGIEQGADVVSGWRRFRRDPWLSRILPSITANWLISRITGVRLHDHGCTLKAYRRHLFDSFRLYGEMHRFVPVHAAWAGARLVEVEVRHHPRTAGTSKYGIGRTWKVILDLMTIKFLLDYGSRPLHVFGSVGIVSCALGVLSGGMTLVQRAMDPEAYVHRNPLILLAVFLFLLGMQAIMMGLLAEIGIRTHHEVRGGRAYVVAEVLRRGAPIARNNGPSPA